MYPSMFVLLGISETQKNNRQKRNLISTKINIIAWVVEVSLYLQNNHQNHYFQMLGIVVFLLPLDWNPLPLSLKVWFWKLVSIPSNLFKTTLGVIIFCILLL